MCDIHGPGVIRHIWITANVTKLTGRTLVLRMYWDRSDVPSVEAPLGDFFGVGNAVNADVDSWPITVTSEGRARNCWWPMFFSDGARMTVTNDGPETVGAFYYYVDYLALDGPPPTRERFHAQYRQAYPADMSGNYVYLDTCGRGRYVGVVYSIESTAPQWWGEGDDLIEVDDHEPLRGTGTEDYFCDAWGTRQHARLWHGTPVCEGFATPGQRTTTYRFHILDPIPFDERIRVSIEHGTGNDRADNLSSVAFWYQEPPASPFPPLPPAVERLGEADRQDYIRQTAWQMATDDDHDRRSELLAMRRCADPANALLVDGLVVYVEGLARPDERHLTQIDACLDALQTLIDAVPADQRYARPDAGAPTGPEAPVAHKMIIALGTLLRARFDLTRRAALARGKLQPGDEIIVEARDARGQLTPPPAFEATPDFSYSYAKVDDPRLMGSGAHFTYGRAGPGWARFTPDLPRSGCYEVLVVFSYGANAGDTRYEVRHADGATVVPLAQRGRPDTEGRNNAKWHSLGIFRFEGGQDVDAGSVTLRAGPGTAVPNKQAEYRAYADAVRFVFVGE